MPEAFRQRTDRDDDYRDVSFVRWGGRAASRTEPTARVERAFLVGCRLAIEHNTLVQTESALAGFFSVFDAIASTSSRTDEVVG